MSGEELDHLARLAQRVPRHGTIVEIGAALGQSSWVLAANADPSVTIYCIEDWAERGGEESAQSLATFRANLAPFANVIALSGRNPVDFVGWQREIDLLVENTGASDPCSAEAYRSGAAFCDRRESSAVGFPAKAPIRC